MPRETRALQDLPAEQRQRVERRKRQQLERAKRPNQLTLPERMRRLEIILGVD